MKDFFILVILWAIIIWAVAFTPAFILVKVIQGGGKWV